MSIHRWHTRNHQLKGAHENLVKHRVGKRGLGNGKEDGISSRVFTNMKVDGTSQIDYIQVEVDGMAWRGFANVVN